MKVKARVAVVLGLMIVAGIASAGIVPKEIKDRYKSLERVMERVDFKAFSNYFSPNFVSIGPDGSKTSKADFLEQVKPLFDAAKKGVAHEKLHSATTKNGQVSVSFDFTLDLIGDSGTTKVHEVGVDTWKKEKGRWVLIKTVDKSFSVTPPKA